MGPKKVKVCERYSQAGQSLWTESTTAIELDLEKDLASPGQGRSAEIKGEMAWFAGWGKSQDDLTREE